jgi:hypothetical protein
MDVAVRSPLRAPVRAGAAAAIVRAMRTQRGITGARGIMETTTGVAGPVLRTAPGWYGAWAASWGMALVLAAGYAVDLAADRRLGQPELDVKLDRAADWDRMVFRPLGSGTYVLWVHTAGAPPPWGGEPFAGRLEVEVADLDGRVLATGAAGPDAAGHVRSDEAVWTELGRAELRGGLLERYVLRVRVSEPDPRFAGSASRVAVYRDTGPPDVERADRLRLVPAVFLAVLSLLLSIRIAVTAGARWTLKASTFLLLALLLLVAFSARPPGTPGGPPAVPMRPPGMP